MPISKDAALHFLSKDSILLVHNAMYIYVSKYISYSSIYHYKVEDCHIMLTMFK